MKGIQGDDGKERARENERDTMMGKERGREKKRIRVYDRRRERKGYRES